MLDGGLATLLEAHGHDLSSALWSARLLAENPAAITAAHREYFEAGAQVAITSSYQASFQGFAQLGLDRGHAEDLLRRSVRLAREAADTADPQLDGRRSTMGRRIRRSLRRGARRRLGVPRGLRADRDELREWHRPRLEILADSGADVFALETIPCLAEAEALLEEVSGAAVCPAWLSMTCSHGRTRAGEPAEEAFAMAAGIDEIMAVGRELRDSVEAGDLVATAVESSGKPAVVYPNSGESWDAERRSWAGTRDLRPRTCRRLGGNWCPVGRRVLPGRPFGDQPARPVGAGLAGW